MSLHSGEIDDIMLPPTTRAIKDLHISPHNNGLAVFGSLGKKLSVIRFGHCYLFSKLPLLWWFPCFLNYLSIHLFSLESHNTVLSYDLPVSYSLLTISYEICFEYYFRGLYDHFTFFSCRLHLGLVLGIATALTIFMLDYRFSHFLNLAHSCLNSTLSTSPNILLCRTEWF